MRKPKIRLEKELIRSFMSPKTPTAKRSGKGYRDERLSPHKLLRAPPLDPGSLVRGKIKQNKKNRPEFISIWIWEIKINYRS